MYEVEHEDFDRTGTYSCATIQYSTTGSLPCLPQKVEKGDKACDASVVVLPHSREELAEEALGLVDKLEHAKIESYLQEKKHIF